MTTSGAQTGPPDDVQELEQEIAQTRQQLGETVEQLIAKADVRARARTKAAELASRVKDKTSQAWAQAAAHAGKARDQLAGKSGGTGSGKTLLDVTVNEQPPGRIASAAATARKAAPEPVWQAVAKAAGIARQRRALVAVAAGVLTAGYVAIRWSRK
jgi:hypothetical protein